MNITNDVREFLRDNKQLLENGGDAKDWRMLWHNLNKLSSVDSGTIVTLLYEADVDLLELSEVTGINQEFCYVNLDKLVIPKRITNISQNSFRDAVIKDLYMPDNVDDMWISSYAFKGCTINRLHVSDINDLIKLPLSYISTQPIIYINDQQLTDFVVPNDTQINNVYFNPDQQLTSVDTTDASYVYEKQFKDQKQLKTLVLGEKISAIGENAFKGCTSLTDVVYEGTIEQYTKVDLYNNCFDGVPARVVHCTDGDTRLRGTTL